MLLEGLLFFTCVGGFECNQSLKAYKEYNPYVKTLTKKTKKQIEENVSKESLILLTTYGGILRNSYTIKVYKNITFTHKKDYDIITFTWRF